MSKGKNFFYRIEPMVILSEMICIPESERGAWAVKFFSELKNGDADNSTIEIASDIIREAHEYRARRANAGSKGGLAKSSNAVAKSSNATPMLPQCSSKSVASKQLAVNSNKKIKEKTTPEKTTYLENVFLSETEFQTLLAKHGQEKTDWMLQKLSSYKLANGKSYKSDYGAINQWVVEAADKSYKPSQKETGGSDDRIINILNRHRAATGCV